MTFHISLSANNKNIDKIMEKANSLKAKIHDDLGWGDGYKYSEESKRNIKVFTYSEALWQFLLDLEPTVEETKKAKRAKSGLFSASPEEILKLGYDESGKK